MGGKAPRIPPEDNALEDFLGVKQPAETADQWLVLNLLHSACSDSPIDAISVLLATWIGLPAAEAAQINVQKERQGCTSVCGHVRVHLPL